MMNLFCRLMVVFFALTSSSCFAAVGVNVNESSKPTKVAIQLEVGNQQIVKNGEVFTPYTMKVPHLLYTGPVKVISRNLLGEMNECNLHLREDGVIVHNTKELEDPFLLCFISIGYGEPLELSVIPTDNNFNPLPNIKRVGLLSFIPRPLETTNDKGRKFALTANDASGTSFMAKISGFLPNEECIFKSRSCGETLQHTFKVGPDGTLAFMYSPAVQELTKGPFEISIENPNMKPLKITHFWGGIAFTSKGYEKLKEAYADFFNNIPEANA